MSTTHPAGYAPNTPLPAASLNHSLSQKADLSDATGLLDDSQAPAGLTAAVAAAAALAAAAVPSASVGTPGGPAGPLDVDGHVPAGQVGLVAGPGVTIVGRTISAAGGGGGGSLAFAPPRAADLPVWLTRGDGMLGQDGVSVDTAGGLSLVFPSNPGISRARGVFMPVPAGSYQVTARVKRVSGIPLNYHCPGLAWLNLPALVADHLAMTIEPSLSHTLTRFTWPGITQDTNVPGNGVGVNSQGANAVLSRPCWGGPELSFRLTKTATMRWFEISVDEIHWEFVQGTALADPTTPTHIGILAGTYHGLNDFAGAHPVRLLVPRWQVAAVADDWTPIPPAGTPLA